MVGRNIRYLFRSRWEFRSAPVAPPAGCSLLPRNSEVARTSAGELEIINLKKSWVEISLT